ncbi:hypothetical protein H0X10_02995 [Candidatus Saccharibacteria bacterium]|nr:hypothetical protein [Candidatus Saccharibacteria bacterium]
MQDENNIEVLRLQSPEELGEHRVYEFTQALSLLENSLCAMGISYVDQVPTDPVVPQSEEVNKYQQTQAAAIVAEAEQITKEAVTDRVLNDVLNAYEGVEQNPLFNIGADNA